MNVGCGRIDPEFYAQRVPKPEFFAQFLFADDLCGPLLYQSQSFIGLHDKPQNSASASGGRGLLVFVQQLAHLVNCQRSILSRERLLTFTLSEESAVICVRVAGNFFIRLTGIAGPTRGLARVSRAGISDWLVRGNARSGALAGVRLRIELPRKEVAYSGKAF